MVMLELLSLRQAAEQLGVSRMQVIRLIRQGKLPNAFLVGRVWAIPQSDIDNLKDEMRQGDG